MPRKKGKRRSPDLIAVSDALIKTLARENYSKLGRSLGLSRDAVGKWARGLSIPRPPVFKKMVDLYPALRKVMPQFRKASWENPDHVEASSSDVLSIAKRMVQKEQEIHELRTTIGNLEKSVVQDRKDLKRALRSSVRS